MTYYYDSEAKVMIAVDPETEDVRVLEPIDFEEEPESKPGKKTDAKPARATGKGCPECGSPSRHKKDCSKASSSKVGGSGKPKRQKLSQLDFEVVKEQQRDDATSDYVAKRFNLDPQEVVDAFASDNLTFDVRERGVRLLRIAEGFHAKFLLWGDDDVVVTSINWCSWTSPPHSPLGEIGVHVHRTGIARSLAHRLSIIWPQL
jgi:hypothetical protein